MTSMETEASLNRAIDDAKRHYSSMFTLPTVKKTLAAVAALCIIMGVSSYTVPHSQDLIASLALGVALFVLTFAADSITTKLILRGDAIFTLRRTAVLSLFSLTFWFVFIIVGVGLSFPFGVLAWVELSLLGYAIVVTLRIVVLKATSMASIWSKGFTVLLQPTFCVTAFVVYWAGIKNGLPLQVLPYLVVSPVIALVAVLAFYGSLQRLGRAYSMDSLPLFQAFIANWVTNANTPLEIQLEKMGQDAEIEVNLLKFDGAIPIAAIIVPQVHPGPFKNIGSSLLPSLLKQEYEKHYGGAACVPLGLLGHELDLASQPQNHKVISQVIASANFVATESFASPFVRVNQSGVTASCQVFGNTVFLSFTLAPKTTEDLPQELGQYVAKEAAKLGFDHALVVNTHNCLADNLLAAEQPIGELQTTALKCLQKVALLPAKTFRSGSASIFPKEFSLKAGMGAGGITAVVIEVEKQKTVYIVIDGNNMVPGLREKIIGALDSLGFDEAEVFTTDTHAVSALVTGRRGYSPIGEVMDNELLIRYVGEAAKNAMANLESSRAGFQHLVVPQVRVIGGAQLKSLTILVDKTIQRAKQLVFPVFGLETLILLLLLIFMLK